MKTTEFEWALATMAWPAGSSDAVYSGESPHLSELSIASLYDLNAGCASRELMLNMDFLSVSSARAWMVSFTVARLPMAVCGL